MLVSSATKQKQWHRAGLIWVAGPVPIFTKVRRRRLSRKRRRIVKIRSKW